MIRITRIPKVSQRYFSLSSPFSIQHKGSFKNNDYTVESDEIVTDNNPWSPTLYTDRVYVKQGVKSVALDEKYRLSYSPLYEAPGAKYISLLKRLSLSFAVLGAYGGKLFYESSQFDDVFALYTILATTTPAVFIQYKTKDYITRIFRLYDKSKPQTLENLTQDEQLVMEKLNGLGSKTYNEVLKISGNDQLKLDGKQGFFKAYGNWKVGKRRFYVVDNIGGIKMDRLWGIVEKNSGVNNGRFLDTSGASNNEQK